jgi:hypothetical protein
MLHVQSFRSVWPAPGFRLACTENKVPGTLTRNVAMTRFEEA